MQTATSQTVMVKKKKSVYNQFYVDILEMYKNSTPKHLFLI